MRTIKLRVLLAIFAFTISAYALEVPPAPTRWMTDVAGVLSADEVRQLDQKLEAFEKRHGTQFLIYVARSLENDSLERFSIEAATKWKAGSSKYDNGLVLFVFIDGRKIRNEVGYGLEGTVTDAVSATMIRDVLAPPFQRGAYFEGLNAAADFLISTIEKGEAPVPLAQQGGGAQAKLRASDILFLLFFLFVLSMVIKSMSRRGGSGCIGCIPLPFGGGGFTYGGGGGFGGSGGFGGGFSGGGGGFGGGGASGGW